MEQTTHLDIQAARAYMSELAADIRDNGGIKDGQSIDDALIEAHARRQAFAQEMADGKTQRAKMALVALAAVIYNEVHAQRTVEHALWECGQIAGGAA